jgi:hypothetical protein
MKNTHNDEIRREYAKKQAELLITHLYDIDCCENPTSNSILIKRPENLTYVNYDAERIPIYLFHNPEELRVSYSPFTVDCINPDIVMDPQEAGELQIMSQMLFYSPVKFHKLLQNDKPRKRRFFRLRKMIERYNDYLEASLSIMNERLEKEKLIEKKREDFEEIEFS